MANILALPTDPRLLEAVGKIAISHGQLEYVLRLTIKVIAGLPLKEARTETSRQTSKALRDRVRKLALIKLGQSHAVSQLEALLTRAEDATARRNRLIHDICYQDKYGKLLLKEDNSPARPYPTIKEVKILLSDIREIAADINDARKTGFLHRALASV